MFPRALEIAIQAHKNQTRKVTGEKWPEPYIEHSKRVASYFKDDIRKTVSILHDVIEDAPVFEKVIKKEFSKTIYEAIIILTRQENENYFNFIMRVKNSDSLAISIKIADLQDNMSDLQEGSKKDKYRFALYILANVL